MFKFFGGRGEAPKNEPIKEPLKDSANQEESKKESPLAGLSLEEMTKILEEKKSELEKLEDERIDYHIDAKNFEEKMIALGISEKQKEEIRQQVKSEGGEISQKIIDIRNKYGFEPSPVEILSSRMVMMMFEKKRMADNLQINKKEIQDFINITLKSLNKESLNKVVDYFLSSIKKTKENKDEYSNENKDLYELADKINSAMDNVGDNFETIKGSLVNFSEKLKEDIKKNRFYKTPLELKTAKERYVKVNKIIDNIYSELSDACKGEGRYAKK